MRFCTSCMTAAGLPAAASKLALVGCKSSRLTFCDGVAHNCTVVVDQFGTEIVAKSLAAIVEGRPSDTLSPASPSLRA